MPERRHYGISLTVNGRQIHEVLVDSHYETEHSDITDTLILELVMELDGKEFQPDERNDDWEFFMVDRLMHHGKPYRLVWCLPRRGRFLGVINCFRR